MLGAPVHCREAVVEISQRAGDRDGADRGFAFQRVGLGLELGEHALDLLGLAFDPVGPALVLRPERTLVTRQDSGPSAIACSLSATQRSRPLRGRSFRPLCWLSRYSQITGESKRSMPLTESAGTLPTGCHYGPMPPRLLAQKQIVFRCDFQARHILGNGGGLGHFPELRPPEADRLVGWPV